MSEGFRRGIRPPSELRPPEWAAKFVRVQNSERAPYFDVLQTPWWLRPMKAAADNEVKEVVVLAPTGSGKSTMAEGLIPWIVSEDPGPLLYASQTDEDSKFWAESRLLPTLKACEPLKGLWPDDRHKSRKMEIIWPHMPMVLGGANMSNFQEKSVRWLYGDEVWKWGPGLVREFLARHHNRWNRRVFLVSQGGVTTDELTQEWEKTDQAEFCWECPECGTLQPYSSDQLVMDDVKVDGELDEQATADTARLVCGGCSHEFADTVSNRRMLSSSAIDNPDTEDGYLIKEGTRPLHGYIGCHVHAFAIWWVPWSEYGVEKLIAMRQLKAGLAEKYRQLIQKRDARPWEEDMAESKSELRQGGYTRDDYSGGDKIEDEAERFMTVDVGKDHYWAVIRAWKHGGASRLLWEGYVPDDATLERLQADYGVREKCVLLDTGYDTQRIYDLIVKNGWQGIKGEDQKTYRHPVKGKRGGYVEKPFSRRQKARPNQGGLAEYYLVSVSDCKDVLHRLRHGQGADWEVPSDVSPAYLNQIDSEAKRPFKNAKTGQEVMKWVKVRRANHLFDCEVYQVACAMMLGVFND